MNLISILILAAVGISFIAALAGWRRRRLNSCSGGCSGCSFYGNCKDRK